MPPATRPTRESYRDAIERVIIPYFKRTAPTLKLDDVAPTDLRQFIAELASQGLAPATVRRYFSPLRAMLATAYEDGLTSRNPAAGLRVIVQGERESKPKRMTPERTRALLAAMPAEHADMTYLMAATGLRIGETLALIWSDLDLDDDGRPVLTVRTSKTAAGERTIPLSPETVRRLTKRRSEAAHSADDAPMFASSVGTVIDAHNWRRSIFRPAAACSRFARTSARRVSRRRSSSTKLCGPRDRRATSARDSRAGTAYAPHVALSVALWRATRRATPLTKPEPLQRM